MWFQKIVVSITVAYVNAQNPSFQGIERAVENAAENVAERLIERGLENFEGGDSFNNGYNQCGQYGSGGFDNYGGAYGRY